jgi:hypothetical protein
MNINKLEKATKILEKIKLIDAEIIEIDKLAHIILNNETNIQLAINVENLTKAKEAKEKVSFDEDGSMTIEDKAIDAFRNSFYPADRFKIYMDGVRTKKSDRNFSQPLSDKLTLQILGVLLCEKNAIKDSLMKKLVGFGFSI